MASVTWKRASLILSNITPRLEPLWCPVGEEGVGLLRARVQRLCPADTQSALHRHTHATSDLLNPASLSSLGTRVECEGCPSYRVTNADIKFSFGRKQQNLRTNRGGGGETLSSLASCHFIDLKVRDTKTRRV